MTNISAMDYSPRTRERAERALRCSSFRLSLFVAMRSRGISAKAIAGQAGIDRGYTDKPLLELSIDNDLSWLIQVGLLRREVDGQGITDSFRLTPLGRQIVAEWESQGEESPKASICDRFANPLNRWLKLPI